MLVMNNGIVKIADLGLSERIGRGQRLFGVRGTTGFMAPEVLTSNHASKCIWRNFFESNFNFFLIPGIHNSGNAGYGYMADLFSLTVSCATMATREEPSYSFPHAPLPVKACDRSCSVTYLDSQLSMMSDNLRGFIMQGTRYHVRCRSIGIKHIGDVLRWNFFQPERRTCPFPQNWLGNRSAATGNVRQAERILDLFPAPVLARLGM